MINWDKAPKVKDGKGFQCAICKKTEEKLCVIHHPERDADKRRAFHYRNYDDHYLICQKCISRADSVWVECDCKELEGVEK